MARTWTQKQREAQSRRMQTWWQKKRAQQSPAKATKKSPRVIASKKTQSQPVSFYAWLMKVLGFRR